MAPPKSLLQSGMWRHSTLHTRQHHRRLGGENTQSKRKTSNATTADAHAWAGHRIAFGFGTTPSSEKATLFCFASPLQHQIRDCLETLDYFTTSDDHKISAMQSKHLLKMVHPILLLLSVSSEISSWNRNCGVDFGYGLISVCYKSLVFLCGLPTAEQPHGVRFEIWCSLSQSAVYWSGLSGTQLSAFLSRLLRCVVVCINFPEIPNATGSSA